MNKPLLITALVASCIMGSIASEHNEPQGIANKLKTVVDGQLQAHQPISKLEKIKHNDKTFQCVPLNPPETIKLQGGKEVTVESATSPVPNHIGVTLRIPTQDNPTPGMETDLLLTFNCTVKK
jgi:hypothetical protein